jgi:hypothetical protein
MFNKGIVNTIFELSADKAVIATLGKKGDLDMVIAADEAMY